MEEDIRIYIIEDDEVIMESLQFLIKEELGFRLTGGSVNAEDAILALKYVHSDVLLLDVSLPGMNGIEAIPLIKELQPDLNILMLTVHEDSDTVFSALRNGAIGYLLKGTPPNNLFKGIRDVLQGGAPISPSIARSIVETFRVENIPVLSQREMEVLIKLSDGNNNSQIAKELFVSANTIKAHIKSIYKKLHVHTRAAAIRKAMRKGLIK
ncbi:response regulator [Portibacter lacus]|uniref:DNA-binding response regulator n=1 Tax=Portibacter lacus TaxID=1099794 RepID=A0AA37ST57_9BACT|nr:response regulator transcription factor [Portibacter lacus]GLR17555.1 DNA-binding response regulator [Portibacter lacus]